MRARVLLPVLLAGALACSGSQVRGGGGRDTAVAARSIDEVLAAHTDSLMKLPGVVGTAVGLCDGERCINVLLKDSSASGRIPARLEGYRVVTIVTGSITPR